MLSSFAFISAYKPLFKKMKIVPESYEFCGKKLALVRKNLWCTPFLLVTTWRPTVYWSQILLTKKWCQNRKSTFIKIFILGLHSSNNLPTSDININFLLIIINSVYVDICLRFLVQYNHWWSSLIFFSELEPSFFAPNFFGEPDSELFGSNFFWWSQSLELFRFSFFFRAGAGAWFLWSFLELFWR